MKIKWNEKYTTIALYSFLVISTSILFYNIISKLDSVRIQFDNILNILSPFIIGFVISYLLNFILKFYEEKVLSNEIFLDFKAKSKRVMALVLTYISILLLLYLFLIFVFPQLTESIVGLANDIPSHVNSVTQLFNDTVKNLDIDDEYIKLVIEKWNEFIAFLIQFVTNLIPMFGNLLKSMVASVWNIVLGIIISIYMLLDKEKFSALIKKITYAIFSEDISNKIVELTNRSNDIFGRFVAGKILDSFIVSALTFVILTIFKIPYSILVSFIIGLTNIIPFFGPFIGAVPSFFIILFVSPTKALWFLVIILVIQQIDGNIIGPKILGDSLGISAFWILFSLLISGKLSGFAGMVVGVPLFTVFYSIIKNLVESRLERKGLPVESSEYMSEDLPED